MMESKIEVGDVVRYGDFAWTVQAVRGRYADLVRFDGTELRRAESSAIDEMRLETDEERTERLAALARLDARIDQMERN